METDLSEVIKSDQQLEPSIIKFFMHQLVKGVKFIHDSNIIHRDLVSNIIVHNINILICTLLIFQIIETQKPTRQLRLRTQNLRFRTSTSSIRL